MTNAPRCTVCADTGTIQSRRQSISDSVETFFIQFSWNVERRFVFDGRTHHHKASITMLHSTNYVNGVLLLLTLGTLMVCHCILEATVSPRRRPFSGWKQSIG